MAILLQTVFRTRTWILFTESDAGFIFAFQCLMNFLRHVQLYVICLINTFTFLKFIFNGGRIALQRWVAFYHVLWSQSSPTLCDPVDCSPSGSSVHGDSPGENTGVGCHALLHGIVPSSHTWNPHLLHPLHWYVGPLPLAPPGKPEFYHRTLQINHTYTYITSFLSPPPLLPSHPSGLSQSHRLGSLCYT